MARLMADEDFSHRIVDVLRVLGHDVVTTIEVGLANQEISDAEVLAYATRGGRALLTHNRWDYKRLHRTQAEHAGIIAVPQPPDSTALAQQIHEAIIVRETLIGELVLVNRPVR